MTVSLYISLILIDMLYLINPSAITLGTFLLLVIKNSFASKWEHMDYKPFVLKSDLSYLIQLQNADN